MEKVEDKTRSQAAGTWDERNLSALSSFHVPGSLSLLTHWKQ